MRRILLFAALLLAAVQMYAAPVDVRTAKATATQFIQNRNYAGRLSSPLAGDVKLVHAEMNSQKLDRAVYYIFNTSNGYVIVSGDDRAEQILGYGDGVLDIKNLPCNMRAWLATYQVQIEYLQAHEGMQVETSTSLMAPARIPSVEPLLTALWDQEAPYWNQCIIDGLQCLTGCPATSAAMVYYYWKYPDFMTDEVPSYRCELSTGYYSSRYVTVPALPPVVFDWDNMRDSYSGSYTTAQGNAVATLMRYVGQAEHMDYGVSSVGSGISVDSVHLIVNAYKFFGYDEETVRMVKKTSAYSGGTTLYTDAEWAAIIQEELNEGRPIVFCAVAGGFFGGGHAFNIDGYDAATNKYHINFGWSGSSNNYYALNAFNGGGSVFNQYQQMVIGIQPPIKTPRLKADVKELTMECYKNSTDTRKFNLNGRNLEGDVTITLNDDNGVFSIDKQALTPDEENRVTEAVNVTYAPKAEGNYTATVVISSPGVEDIEITLNGSSDYELYRPMMLDVDAEAVTATSFRADWSDNTPAENVLSYTLEVKSRPDVNLITMADWSDVPQESTNHASDAQNYMPDGWTFTGTHLYLDGGFLSPGRNSVIKIDTDWMNYNIVSIIINAKAYSKGSNTTLKVATDLGEKTLVLAKDVETYLVVLEIGSHGTISITTGYYPEIQSIKVYGGEITDPAPFALNAANETGDATYRLIEGITPDKFYTVTGLTPGGSFLYRVMSHYVNGTESKWSNTKEVVLAQGGAMRGDVDGDGKVNIDDVTALIDYLLQSGAGGANIIEGADCDQNGTINIDDVTALIDYLLGGQW